MSKPEASLIIKNANEVVTMKEGSAYGDRNNSDLGILPNGSVAVNDDKIVWVGNTEDIPSCVTRARGCEIIDAADSFVMPGFVDSHTHLLFSGSRENEFSMKVSGVPYVEIQRRGGGILRTVAETRRASDTDILGESVARMKKMLLHGTTTVEVKSGYGLDTNQEIRMLKLINELPKRIPMTVVPTFLGAHLLPVEFIGNKEDYVGLVVNEMIPQISRLKLADFCDVFCDETAFSVEDSRRILARAREYKLGLKIHADEFQGPDGAALAAELEATSADHLVTSRLDSIRKMASRGVVATILPVTSFVTFLGNHADVRKMVQIGCRISIASDICPNSWCESMQLVIGLACVNSRVLPEEALRMATLNGAYALGKESSVGSLEIGKQADILVMNTPTHAFIPYKFGANLVRIVIKNGKVVVRDGQLSN